MFLFYISDNSLCMDFTYEISEIVQLRSVVFSPCFVPMENITMLMQLMY